MALYAFDGTWNAEKTDEDLKFKNTNVVRFRDAYEKNSGKTQFYRSGVGTRYDFMGRVFGGLFGLGELPRIVEAYEHLCGVWEQDTTIDVVGFSRGAATALDFCHYVQEKGIRRPGTDDVVEKSPRINFLGLWDVVAAFGLANLGNVALNFGHHLSLPRENIKYCFHALALDERRLPFLPTRVPGACEVWFRGVHSDVGGGNGNTGLNDISLRWMFRKALAAGLPITEADIEALKPEVTQPQPARNLRLNVRAVVSVDRRHYTVTDMPGWTTPPATCPVESEAEERRASEVGAKGIELLSEEVQRRMQAMWDAADAVARANDFTLDYAKVWLLTLIEGRVGLVTNDAQLALARANTGVLIARAVHKARLRGFHVLSDFFLNEALFESPHLFPLTD